MTDSLTPHTETLTLHRHPVSSHQHPGRCPISLDPYVMGFGTLGFPQESLGACVAGINFWTCARSLHLVLSGDRHLDFQGKQFLSTPFPEEGARQCSLGPDKGLCSSLGKPLPYPGTRNAAFLETTPGVATVLLSWGHQQVLFQRWTPSPV